MKKISLIVNLVLLVCMAASLVSFNAARATVAPAQVKVQPFCKFTLIDHRGHSIKLSTNVMHASHTSITFIFETGEKLIIKFVTIRAGHFVAESARSKDPNILFYPSHSSHPLPMVGAVIISSVKPILGNFSHLLSDDDEYHLNLVSGTFSF
ncbi:hypothetical protein KXQ82_08395 [Mucilaginibacter sp. HMF5004]|uniref:hypothetical protein n=1 Tax=Mucilaginibacter rivuli TaxID=2857527 RepID=UPI001C5EA92C|nr:hypothetical protein [Mucilaginibacter rivuli]MBW4889733.1 hypothetical protein [Mucilaginibacter rivuli]